MRLSLKRYFHCPKLQYAWIIWETKWSLQGKENDQQSTRKERVLGLFPRRNGKPLHSAFAFFFCKQTQPSLFARQPYQPKEKENQKLLPSFSFFGYHFFNLFFLPTFYAFSKATKPTKHQPKCSLKLQAFFSFLFFQKKLVPSTWSLFMGKSNVQLESMHSWSLIQACFYPFCQAGETTIWRGKSEKQKVLSIHDRNCDLACGK